MGHLCAQVLPTPDVHWLPDVPVQGPSHAQGVSESPPPAQCREGKICFGTTWSAGALSWPPLPRHLSSGLATAPSSRAHALLTPASRGGRPWFLLAWAGGTGGTALSSTRGRDQEWMWPCPSFLHSVSLPKSPPQSSLACPCWVSPPPPGGGEAGGAGWVQPREGWVEPDPVTRSRGRSMALGWAGSGRPACNLCPGSSSW